MKKTSFLMCMFLMGCVLSINADPFILQNSHYKVSCSEDGMMVVTDLVSSQSRTFTTTILVAHTTTKLSVANYSPSMDVDFESPVVGWNKKADLYSIPSTTYNMSKPSSITCASDVITITYPEQTTYNLSATLSLPSDGGEPIYKTTLTSKVDGYYSVGYYGAPEVDYTSAKELWQPMPFNGKRMPTVPYLTPAFMCSLPATFVTIGGITYGVYADPSEFPFTPLPVSISRSRFGVSVRNKLEKENQLKPSIWAPILGTNDSKLGVGKTTTFKFRFYVTDQTIDDAYRDIAIRQFHFGDFRHNDLGTLNDAMDNMIDYAMNSTEVWSAPMKGCRYDTDVPGSVKNTSALDAYAMAFVTDNDTILNDRAYPMMEFLLSRKKVNYAPTTTTQTGQTATNELGTPCMNVSELLQFYRISNSKMKVMYEYALQRKSSAKNTNENGIRQNFSFYEATGEDYWYKELTDGVNQYINEEITNKPTKYEYVNHGRSSYWAQIAPKFVELYETYLATRDIKYLQAARDGARIYAKFLWMCPTFSMTDSVLCNKGGKAPRYAGRKGTLIDIPEEMAPAWRLSEMGLQTECGQTSGGGHKGVFTGNYAPTMRRIGALTADTFLMDIGKAAVIGRYMNFPGYHINTDRTTVYEKEDFPWHPLAQLLTTTSIHQSHIWPQIAKLMDYLVSDVAVASHQAIDFPSFYVQNIVHMQNNVYMKDGVFYGDKDLVLYMPKQLAMVGNKELNYIAAYGNGCFYMAFTNQSNQSVNTTVTLNKKYLLVDGKQMVIWQDNVQKGGGTVQDNQLSVSVSPHGITAVKVMGVTPQTRLQSRMIPNTRRNEWNQYLISNIEVGASHAMLLNPSDSLSRLFVYSSLECGTLSEYQISYRINDATTWTTLTDKDYPFEFSITLDTVSSIDFTLTCQGKTSEPMRFERLSPTINMKGWNTVTKAQGADLTFDLSGEAPYQFSYTDGESTTTITTDSVSYIQHVSPKGTTYYSLLSMTDETKMEGQLSGDAKVCVVDDGKVMQQAPVLSSAYINATKATASFVDQTSLELKGIASSGREIYLKVNPSSIQLQKNERLYVGLYLVSTTRLSKDGLLVRTLLNECPAWTSSLNWSNRLQAIAPIDTIGVTPQTLLNQYLYWDITEWAKKQTSEAYLQLVFLDGEETAMLTFGGTTAPENQRPILVVKDLSQETDLQSVDNYKIKGNGSRYTIMGQPIGEEKFSGVVLESVNQMDGNVYRKVIK